MPTDLRYALRTLARSPGFAAVSILCLALGIGVNAAIFSLFDAILLRPLPVPAADRLVILQGFSGQSRPGSSFSYPLFEALRQHSAPAADVFAYGRLTLNLSADGSSDAPFGLGISDNYFTALGVPAALGRVTWSPGEAAVILSHRYWQRRFAQQASILGRTISLNGMPVTIVGIAPRAFFGTEIGRAPDIFVPLTLHDQLSTGGGRLAQPNRFWLRVMARVTPGVTAEQALTQLRAGHAEHVRAVAGSVSPGLRSLLEKRQVAIVPGARGPFGLGEEFGVPLRILMATAGAVLLIACANLAALLLARGAARRRERAIRLALGVGRWRLVRLQLCESALLSAAGGALGLLLGVWSANAFVALLADRVLEVQLDGRLVSFALLATAGTTVLFGTVPALRGSRADVAAALRSGSHGSSATGQPGRFLIPAQIALSLVLLVVAGLFIRTLSNLRGMDAGFRGDHVVVATTNPGLSRYTAAQTETFYQHLLERAAALPGVRSAAIADAPLLGGTFIDGLSLPDRPEAVEVSLRQVGPRFLDTMSIRLLAGRDFTAGDDASAARVAIVNETIVRRYFAGQDPIGKRIGVSGVGSEIVGVIADTRYSGLRDAIPNTVYVPLAQARFLSAERTLHVRAFSDAGGLVSAVTAQIRDIDPGVPARVRPFSQLVDADLERERLVAILCGCFAGLALLLTSIGLYGMMAQNVQRRTREIGIRLSLGAPPLDVWWMVLRRALITALLGIAAGAPVSLWLSRAVRSQLFEIAPHDPITAAAAAATLVATALLAALAPARRASSVDPIVALREE